MPWGGCTSNGDQILDREDLGISNGKVALKPNEMNEEYSWCPELFGLMSSIPGKIFQPSTRYTVGFLLFIVVVVFVLLLLCLHRLWVWGAFTAWQISYFQDFVWHQLRSPFCHFAQVFELISPNASHVNVKTIIESLLPFLSPLIPWSQVMSSVV